MVRVWTVLFFVVAVGSTLNGMPWHVSVVNCSAMLGALALSFSLVGMREESAKKRKKSKREPLIVVSDVYFDKDSLDGPGDHDVH